MASLLYYYTHSGDNNDLYTNGAFSTTEVQIRNTQKSVGLGTTPTLFALDEDNDTTRGVSRITNLSVDSNLNENIQVNYNLQVGDGTNWFYLVYALPIKRRMHVPVITCSNPIYFSGSSSVQLRHWVQYVNPHNKPLSPTNPKADITFERIYRV